MREVREDAPLEYRIGAGGSASNRSPSTRRGSDGASSGTARRRPSPGWTTAGAGTAGPLRTELLTCGGSRRRSPPRRRTVGVAEERERDG